MGTQFVSSTNALSRGLLLDACQEKIDPEQTFGVGAKFDPSTQDAENEPEFPVQTIVNMILSRMRDVPDEVMRAMPEDGASEHDHYIYGWPKRRP